MRFALFCGLPFALAGVVGAAPQGLSYVQNPDPAGSSRFGYALALIDIDRDGHLDLVVGAPGGFRGRVFVYLGPIPEGVTLTSPSFELSSPQPVAGDLFGCSLAVGDVDGDGADELVIGASSWRSGNDPPTGAAFLYDPDDIEPWTPIKSTQARPTYRMGNSVAIGDFLDAPGLEVAVSAPGFRFHPGGPSQGGVHVFSHVKSSQIEHFIPNPNPTQLGHDAQFGHRIAVGDWNGDGREDLAVAAIFNDVFVPALGHHWAGAGQIFIYQSPGMSSPAVTIDNPDPTTDPAPFSGAPCVFQRFGNFLHFGDAVGQDGWDDLTVGAHRKDAQGVCDAGRAFVFTGRTYGYAPVPLIEQESTQPIVEELFGYTLIFADVIGDSRPDWVVGALRTSSLTIFDGAALQGPGPLGPPDAVFVAPPGAGGHFVQDMVAGKLGPVPAPPALDRDEVLLGDPDHDNLSGRVVITYW